MLASLHIQNVALIENAEINFGNNLNVISGETGAGKSITLDALGFVLGDRLDRTMVRTNADFMKVDAFFTCLSKTCVDEIFNETGINLSYGEALISREYNITGKTSCKINGEMITTSMLKKITVHLVDIHGQHEHQALLDNAYQLQILDNFSSKDIGDRLNKLNLLIDKVNEIDNKIKNLGGNKVEKQNLIDLYSFQINEITNANIYEGEFEELENRYKEMKSSEKISTGLNEILNVIDKNAYVESVIDQLSVSEKLLYNLATFGEKYNNLAERLKSVSIELQDIASSIVEINSTLNFDEQEFETIDKRLDYIKTLFRKYGGDYASLQNYFVDITDKLGNLINSEERYNELNKEKDVIIAQILGLQLEISKIRQKNAIVLQEQICEELTKLGMPNAKFIIGFEKISEPYSRKGNDFVEFLFSANLGFEVKPLNKIASGGEISRFMLAYKIVINNLDNIDTLIFDEIDTGISGNIATVVAKCMGRLSRIKQMLVVSHLPQICAMADTNFLVEKSGETITKSNISMIKDSNLIKEIARLMGLMDEKGLNFAKELKLEAETYKTSL